MNTSGNTVLDVQKLREEFPVLQTSVRGKPLVYFDNAATTQKPQSVLSRISQYYTSENANVHRGVHYLADIGTRAFEHSREITRQFIGAQHTHEVIFTRGTTDSINIVAQSLGAGYFKPGDEVLISGMEHHSNIVPWQLLRSRTGIVLRVIPVTDSGELDMQAFHNLISARTRLVSVVHVSNALGTVNPVEDIIRVAHERGIPVLLDGAQAVAHTPVNVHTLGCDFYVFSGHKIFGPTGTGLLYGREEWLNRMPPADGGGEMIATVSFEETTFNELPWKFEAGTPHIAGVIGLGEALSWTSQTGLERIAAHEHSLLEHAVQEMKGIPGIRFIGTAQNKSAIVSFIVEGVHASDLGTLLDMEGIAIRTGHHCTQPLMERFGVSGTARASFSVYNTHEEIDFFIRSLHKALRML